MECAALVDDTLACRRRHELQVGIINQAKERTILQAARFGAAYVRNAVFYGLTGAVFAALGLWQYRFLGLQAVVFILIGLLLLYAAAANFREARHFR